MEMTSPRWFWYFEGLSSKTLDFIEKLAQEEWNEWAQHRYIILWFSDKQVYPPLAWWERECFEAALKVADREPDPRLAPDYDPLWAKLDSKFVQ